MSTAYAKASQTYVVSTRLEMLVERQIEMYKWGNKQYRDNKADFFLSKLDGQIQEKINI